jgi:hypothetical protein
MPHDPALVDVVDGVRCAVHFVDGEFGRWRVDFDEEAGEAITGWLGPPDNMRALRGGDGILAVKCLVTTGRLLSTEVSVRRVIVPIFISGDVLTSRITSPTEHGR